MKTWLTQWESTTDHINEPDGWQVNVRCVLKDFAASGTTSQQKFNEERCHPDLNHKSIVEMKLKQNVFKTSVLLRKDCVSPTNIFLATCLFKWNSLGTLTVQMKTNRQFLCQVLFFIICNSLLTYGVKEKTVRVFESHSSRTMEVNALICLLIVTKAASLSSL